MKVSAPAKINLALSVGPLRVDGFHEIATVFHAISLSDTVTATISEHPRLAITSSVPGLVPADSDNIALRAVAALGVAVGRRPDVSLHIDKRIPVAAGLAGGSADAAAALVACNALWNSGLTTAELVPIAAQLGSDVPFALLGTTMLGSSRGEVLAPVLAPNLENAPLHWVIAASDAGLSTPAVYQTLDQLRTAQGEDIDPPHIPAELMLALRSGEPALIGAALSNDLQLAALRLRPTLSRTLETGNDAGALGALVSGSGPTCVFLARDDEHSIELAVALSSSGTCNQVFRATGPAAGAHAL